MRIALVADSFPPLKNSAAVLVLSLAEALADLGHQLLVITPSLDIEESHVLDDFGVFKVLRIRCGKIKSHSKFMRGISELSLFFALPYEFKKTSYGSNQWDAVIWYSPSIFLGGLVRTLKKRAKCSYLILRDIVPDWMVDIGIMKKGFSYYLLKWFEKYQYNLADVIGVQSPGNKRYIERLHLPYLKELEVLSNWMPSISPIFSVDSFLHTDLQNTILAGKRIMIYAGNLGEAQGIENFAQLILKMKNSMRIGFLIIGRGSKKEWLQDYVINNQIQNVLFLDEVDIVTLSAYYRQCCAGLVFLDSHHQSHNIPGKFISYIEANLPVAAFVNSGNDLIEIINRNGLGIATDSFVKLSNELVKFINALDEGDSHSHRCRDFYEVNYRPNAIANQITAALARGLC